MTEWIDKIKFRVLADNIIKATARSISAFKALEAAKSELVAAHEAERTAHEQFDKYVARCAGLAPARLMATTPPAAPSTRTSGPQ